MGRIERTFNFTEEDEFVIFIDEKNKTVQKWIIKWLDDSPMQDLVKWHQEDVWERHEQEIKREGGFMDD